MPPFAEPKRHLLGKTLPIGQNTSYWTKRHLFAKCQQLAKRHLLRKTPSIDKTLSIGQNAIYWAKSHILGKMPSIGKKLGSKYILITLLANHDAAVEFTLDEYRVFKKNGRETKPL